MKKDINMKRVFITPNFQRDKAPFHIKMAFDNNIKPRYNETSICQLK